MYLLPGLGKIGSKKTKKGAALLALLKISTRWKEGGWGAPSSCESTNKHLQAAALQLVAVRQAFSFSSSIISRRVSLRGEATKRWRRRHLSSQTCSLCPTSGVHQSTQAVCMRSNPLLLLMLVQVVPCRPPLARLVAHAAEALQRSRCEALPPRDLVLKPLV